MANKFLYRTNLSVADVVEKFILATRQYETTSSGRIFSQRPYWGVVSGNQFQLGKSYSKNRSWLPVLFGSIVQKENGTEIWGVFRLRRSDLVSFWLISVVLLAITIRAISNGLTLQRSLAGLLTLGISSFVFILGYKQMSRFKKEILDFLKLQIPSATGSQQNEKQGNG